MSRNDDLAVAREALAAATTARRLFPRRDEHGLEPNGAQVLLALLTEPEQTVNELAAALELAKTTVSHTVTRLQTLGWVAERTDEDDGRRRPQRLTPAGEDATLAVVERLRRRGRD